MMKRTRITSLVAEGLLAFGLLAAGLLLLTHPHALDFVLRPLLAAVLAVLTPFGHVVVWIVQVTLLRSLGLAPQG